MSEDWHITKKKRSLFSRIYETRKRHSSIASYNASHMACGKCRDWVIEGCLPRFFPFMYLLTEHYANVAHRAATKSFKRGLSSASFSIVLQLYLSSLGSFSTVLRQVVFGRPLLRLPSGVQRIVILAMLLLPFRSTCLIHLHLLLVTRVRISSCLVCFGSSSLGIFRGQKILRIFIPIYVEWDKTTTKKIMLNSWVTTLNHTLIYIPN